MDRPIEIRCLDGQSTKVSISPDRSIADLKDSLTKSFLPAKDSPSFHLFFKGGKLRLEDRIGSILIENGEFLVLIPFAKKPQTVSNQNDNLGEINTAKSSQKSTVSEASESAWSEIMDHLSSMSGKFLDDSTPMSSGTSDNPGCGEKEALAGASSSKLPSSRRRKRDTVRNPTLLAVFYSGSLNVFEGKNCDQIRLFVESVNCLSDCQTGKCMLFEGFFKAPGKIEECVCPSWLKKVLKCFSLINVLYGFCQMQRNFMTLDFLHGVIKQASHLGVEDLCISDVQNLSYLCPKVVKMPEKEKRRLTRSSFAIVIGDTSIAFVDEHKSARKSGACCNRVLSSVMAIVDAVEKREHSFKADLWKAVKVCMERTLLDTSMPLLSLQNLLTSVRDHVAIPKGSEEKLVKTRPFSSRCHDQNQLGPVAMIDHLRKGIGVHGQIVHVEKIDAKLAVHADIPGDLSESCKVILKGLGISRLYSHQAEAIQASVSGKNVIVATSTSSGKSLCYNLPVLEDLSHNTLSCALYIFPTKALAQDQLRALLEMTKISGLNLDIGIYDGDTPQDDRKLLKDSARLLITNPDMLHMSILPYHRQFQRILGNLRFIVIDETHMYKGAFGCHVALILRRLRRICSLVYGSDPSFIFCTATSANPQEHAMELANLQALELVQKDGSPSGPKHFVLWNPPLTATKGSMQSRKTRHGSAHDDIITKRSSSILEVSYLFAEMVQHGLRCITFCKTKKLSELVLCYTREILQETAPNLVDVICAYRAGYTPQDRRKIEKDLFGGRLRGVAATNALELGIDVGYIDATLHLGFPGSVASLWQQAGRSGRRGRPSFAVYVAFDGPLDQYFMRFPHKLFQRPIEHVQVDADNKKVLEQHVTCAALELPLCLRYDEFYFGTGLNGAIMALRKKGYLGTSHAVCVSHENLWGYIGPEPRPSLAVSVRAIEPEKYKVIDKKSNETLEEIEESKAFFQVYEGASYMHQGKTYLVTSMDLSLKIALCVKADLMYYTKTRDYTDIHVTGGDLEYPLPDGSEYVRTTAQANNCVVTTKWFGFYRISRVSNQILDSVQLNLPSYSYESQAAWIRVPQSVKKTIEIQQLCFRAGQHAASHALLNVVPLYLVCNVSDLRTECANPNETRNIPERILLYDQHLGGIGVSMKVQLLFKEILTAALELVTSCSCSSHAGCPNCIQTLSCGEYNEVLDKKAAIIILKGVIEAENLYFESRGEPDRK